MKFIVRYKARGDIDLHEEVFSDRESAEVFALNLYCDGGWELAPSVRCESEEQDEGLTVSPSR